MRLIRQLEARIISLNGKMLDLRRERDNWRQKAGRLQAKVERLELAAPTVALKQIDFDQLRDRYKGHGVRRGKVRLTQRETV